MTARHRVVDTHAGRDDHDGVSVVIAHYGDPRHAKSLVEQLTAQSSRLPVQVIVVDDHSPTPFPEISGAQVVRREVNGGFGSAVNSGARAARHDLLLILNSDLSVPNDFVDELLAAAAAHLPAVVSPTVVCRGRTTGGQRFPRARYQAVEWASLLGRWHDRAWFRRAIGKIEPPLLHASRPVDWVAGEAMLLPTADFRAVGGFDESFFMYAEEVDLQRRLSERGVGAVLVGTTPVRHEGAASTDPARAREWLSGSRLQYAEKWGGRGRLRAGLTAATLLNLVTNGARRAAGRELHPLTVARQELRLIWAPRRRTAQARAR